MRSLRVASLGVILVGVAAGVYGAELDAVTEPAMGMTIHGDAAEAVGLYLMPWGNEQVSDIDRPPRLLTENLVAVDSADFKRQVEWDQASRAYQIWRLQRNNW